MKITPYSPELEENQDFLAGRAFQNEICIPKLRERDQYFMALVKISEAGSRHILGLGTPRPDRETMIECIQIAKEALKP